MPEVSMRPDRQEMSAATRVRDRAHHGVTARSLLLLGCLALIAGALSFSVVGTAQADEPGKAKPAAWYTRTQLAKFAGPGARDIRSMGGPLQALLGHGDHPLKLRRNTVAFMPETDVLHASAALTGAPALVNDAWSTLMQPETGEPRRDGIMAALMPSGQVFIGSRYYHYVLPIPAVGQPVPPAPVVSRSYPPLPFATPVTAGDITLTDSTFCAGLTLLADGTLFIAGGTRDIDIAADEFHVGLGSALRWDGAAWQALPNMVGRATLPDPGRWYPTTTRLFDGRVLITGGYDLVTYPLKNLSTEIYNPATSSFSLINAHPGLPLPMFSWQYTHQWQMPYQLGPGEEVMAFGDPGVPGFMKLDGSWRLSTKTRAGSIGPGDGKPNLGTAAMLPLRVNNLEWGYNNGSVIMAGGQQNSPQVDKIDVYDPIADQWRFPRTMGVTRHHPSSVILPDGRILLMGGENLYGSSAGLGRTQYVDPRNGFSVEWGTAEYPEVRGYHNVALLLPDGRVLFGSGNMNYTRGDLNDYRIYSPSYMSGPRPEIQHVPPALDYANYSWVTWLGSEAPSEIVLIGLGAQTHSFDMSQRYIQLPIFVSGTTGEFNYSLYGTPTDARVAPPGHYMMFLLDANHVPSVARIIKVQ